MRQYTERAPWWLLVAAALVVTVAAFVQAGLPSPYLLAAIVVGIAFAVLGRAPLTVPSRAAIAAQGVVGVTAGSYLDRSTVAAVETHLLPILAVSALTVALSVFAGLALARFSRIDRSTAAFGMIAGGSAGIIALSRELGADERLVAVLQYLRVLIIVSIMPVVAIGLFGMTGRTQGVSAGPSSSVHGALYVVCVLVGGQALARRLRLPGWSILGPMLAAGAVSLAFRRLVAPTPAAVADVAFVLIGLDVGLRFTPRALRDAGEMLPRSIVVIVAMLVASAGFGVALSATTHTSMLDGYLATTPGGLPAVVALAVGAHTDTTFVVSVQVIRTLLMLAATPTIAARVASR